jgi:hypothetical protein
MAVIRRKNGVPVLNKLKASGVPITSLGQKFVNLDLEFLQFEISTTQGGSLDLWSNWLGNPGPGADVSWGDGSFETVNANNGLGNDVLHSYASNGNYSIRYYSVNSGLQNAFKDATGQTLVREFITDITSWGWVLSFPKFFNRFRSDYVSVVSATDVMGNFQSLGAQGTALTYVGISAFPDDVWTAGPFAPSTLYNEDISGVRPYSLGTTASGKFYGAIAFNRNLGRWGENNLTRAITSWTFMFRDTVAFNNGGVGGVGVGLDSWNVTEVYSKGTNTSVATNKLIDSSATFISDGVAVGMQVYIIYQRGFTTVASVDSETQLTLNADLFTSSPVNYLVRKPKATNRFQQMFFGNYAFNQYIGSWDITGETYLGFFMDQKVGFGPFNQDISSWDVTSITDMIAAFRNSNFNFGQPIGQANTLAQAWNDRVWQVKSWIAAFSGTDFNSDTSGWSFGKLGSSGTNTTQTDFRLIDSTATFLTDGVDTDDWVTNMDTGKQSKINSVNSETQLTLATNVFVDAGAGENYEIFRATDIRGNMTAVEYDTGLWDTRSIQVIGALANSDPNRTQWDLSGWVTRNINDWSSMFAVNSTWDFEFRNWERGAIGDVNYSTMKCVKTLLSAFNSATSFQNKGCENWDTRNVTDVRNLCFNGVYQQSVGEWDIRSLTTAAEAKIGGNGPLRIKAQVYLQWPFQTPGPLNGVNATRLVSFSNNFNANFSLSETESTVASGTTTGVGATYLDKVIDTSATFVTNGVAIGDTVNNTTTGQHAYVRSVDSETQLTVTQEYFGTIGDSYTVVTGYDGQETYHGYLKLIAPTPSTNRTTGTTTSTTTNKLVDSGASFLTTVGVGDLVKNTTDGTYSMVNSVDSDTELTLANDIFTSGESYSVDGGFGWVISGSTFS